MMGHDPDPWFEFEDENIILWSDEDDVENIYSIQMTQTDFEKQLLVAKQELRYFHQKIRMWAVENYMTDSDRFIDGIENYLFVKNVL